MDDLHVSGINCAKHGQRVRFAPLGIEDLSPREYSDTPWIAVSVSSSGRFVLLRHRAGYAVLDTLSRACRKVTFPRLKPLTIIEICFITDQQTLVGECSVSEVPTVKSIRPFVLTQNSRFDVLPPVFLNPQLGGENGPLASLRRSEFDSLPEMLQRDRELPSTHSVRSLDSRGRIIGTGKYWNGQKKYWCYWDRSDGEGWRFYKLRYQPDKHAVGSSSEKFGWLAIESTSAEQLGLNIRSAEYSLSNPHWLDGKDFSLKMLTPEGSFIGDFLWYSLYRKDGKLRKKRGALCRLSVVCRPEWDYNPLVLDTPRQDTVLEAISANGQWIAGHIGSRVFFAQANSHGYDGAIASGNQIRVKRILHVTNMGRMLLAVADYRQKSGNAERLVWATPQ